MNQALQTLKTRTAKACPRRKSAQDYGIVRSRSDYFVVLTNPREPDLTGLETYGAIRLTEYSPTHRPPGSCRQYLGQSVQAHRARSV